MSRYGHLLPGAMDGALKRLESELFGAADRKVRVPEHERKEGNGDASS